MPKVKGRWVPVAQPRATSGEIAPETPRAIPVAQTQSSALTPGPAAAKTPERKTPSPEAESPTSVVPESGSELSEIEGQQQPAKRLKTGAESSMAEKKELRKIQQPQEKQEAVLKSPVRLN